MKGKCLWFNVTKSFGFIRGEDGKDYFAHYSKIIADPGVFKLLHENDEVEFEPMEVERGGGVRKAQAKDITVIKKGGSK